jgi:hypothetical protein
MAIGETIEEADELRHDLRVEICDATSQLRPAQRRETDLREEHAAFALGRHLDEQEVQRASERALGIEDVELGLERGTKLVDDLVDGRDQERFLRREVVVDESRRNIGGTRDALHRRALEPALHDHAAKRVDDLLAPRLREARSSHK